MEGAFYSCAIGGASSRMKTSNERDSSAVSVRPMYFIIGTGRCGTKMLRSMLIKHPKIKCMMETHFLSGTS